MDHDDAVTDRIIRAAIEVHRQLGPGLLETPFTAQVVTYLRLTQLRVGLLLNFNAPKPIDGLKRVVL